MSLKCGRMPYARAHVAVLVEINHGRKFTFHNKVEMFTGRTFLRLGITNSVTYHYKPDTHVL